MNLALTEEQKLLQRTVREFAENEVKPLAREIDETGHFPRETFRKAAELGLTAVALPESEGGAGFDHVSYSIVIEEISRVCASTGVILSVQNSLYCDPIHRFGTEEQKKKFLAALRARRKNRLLRADRTAGRLERRGARDQGGAPGRPLHHQRHESVDHQRRRGRCGHRVREYRSGEGRKRNHRAGRRARHARLQGGQGRKETRHPRHGVHGISFTDCEVPVGNRIGNEGEGYKIALSTLDGGRIGIAAQATGIAQGAFEQALAYAQQRQAFGHPIADFQAIQFMLADMATEIDAARLLVRKAAWKAGYRRRDFPWKLRSRNFSPRRWPRA